MFFLAVEYLNLFEKLEQGNPFLLDFHWRIELLRNISGKRMNVLNSTLIIESLSQFYSYSSQSKRDLLV
jgi:hypothetical protein